jgi:hypothetical protein
MLTEDRKNIFIIKSFLIDYSLKKHQKQNFSTFRDTENKTTQEATIEFNNSVFIGDAVSIPTNIQMGMSGVINGGFFSSSSFERVWDGIPFQSSRYYSNNFEKYWFKTKISIKSIFYKGRQSPIKYFNNIKSSIEELNNIDEKIQYLEKVSQALRVSGQKQMLEVSLSQKKVLEYEKILKESNFKKFITEDNLVAFTLKCKKGLKMEYINEFNRIIPESVIKNRDKAEELKVFDNYVILHYDPSANVNLVEKKDPILFGLIKNSNKLYFIDDWIDEKCDLTYDKIIKELNIDEEIC